MATAYVITHNGLPPSQGGKRIAYMVGKWIYYINPYEHAAALRRAAAAPKPKPKIPWASLSSARDRWGWCKCGQMNNSPTVLDTDVGQKIGYRCSGCGQLMRRQEY